MIDLIPDAEQESIAAGIREFLADQLPVERHRSDRGRRGRSDREAWRELAGLGCFGIAIPEAQGGLGLGVAEEALAMREFGRALVSPAAIGSAVGARLAASNGRGDLVEEILAGKCWVGIANPAGRTDDGRAMLHLLDVGADDLVLMWPAAGASLYRSSDFDRLDPRASLDPSVRLERAVLKTDAMPVVADADDGGLLPLAATLSAAAMLVGLMEAVRDMAVGYAQTRIQFNVPIGSFQAIKHKCADIGLWCESAWSQTAHAALLLDHAPAKARYQVLSAKLLAAEGALDAARHNIQIHGGMGFTAELNAHLFMKRAHLLGQLGGHPRELRRTIARLDVDEV